MNDNEKVFNLAESSRRSFIETTRGFRRIFGATIVAIIVINVLGLIYQLKYGSIQGNLRATYGIELWFGIAGVVVFYWFWRMFGPGATLLSIDSSGFTLTFPEFEKFVARWDDPNFRVDLTDARMSPLMQKLGYTCFVRVANRPGTVLTTEAMEALIAAGKERKLTITTRKKGGRWSLSGPEHTVIEIRPAP
jgi:hypothetical protein